MDEPEQVEWLPPQAAGAAPPPEFRPGPPPGVDPSWPPPAAPGADPPTTPGAAPPRPQGGTDKASLATGIAGLVMFVFPAGFGLVFIFNLPASIAAWALGRNAGERGRTGMILGIVGTIIGVVAIVGWGLGIAFSEELRSELEKAIEDGQR
ncbi:MAG TPA: hypothetical protein VNB64_05955 [Solirubrobacteraceae bacterium]|nr:hypothetical protein [Solirubrobacteraceae bacterium]